MAGVIKYNWTLIQKAHDEGATWRELGSEFGVTVGGLHYASKRGDFSSRNASEAWEVSRSKGRKVCRKSGKARSGNGATKYNWSLIQESHDKGATWKELRSAFGVALGSLAKASKRGDFIPRNGSEAMRLARKKGRFPAFHTEETKTKMSKIRIKFLRDNPDKNPFRLYHSSKKSYPEERFEDALRADGITGWVYAFQHSIYEYDFAFPEQKIDVEIDGRTHQMARVQEIDRRRDAFSMNQGWTVLRFPATRIKYDVDGCVQELKAVLATRTTAKLTA